MFRHSTNTASLCSVLIAALIVWLSLAGVATAQNTFFGTGALQNNTTGLSDTAFGFDALFSNTIGSNNTANGANTLFSNTTGNGNTANGASTLFSNTIGNNNTANGFVTLFKNTTGINNTADGAGTLFSNTTGNNNTANGVQALITSTTGNNNTADGFVALFGNTTGNDNTANGVGTLVKNTTGNDNTAVGFQALANNLTGSTNTAIGAFADVATGAGNLINATAIGAGALVDASNKIRLGSTAVTVIEGQVALTVVSDKTKKENFQPVDGEAVLEKISGLELLSWNFIGHDPTQFRHYGPMAQDFFAAFGHDGVGQIGSETTINSGDMAGILMIAVQALEKRTAELKQKEAQIAVLESQVEDLKAKHAYFVETVAARLEALESPKNHSIQITAKKSLGDNIVDVVP
jgi:hypothetical protein